MRKIRKGDSVLMIAGKDKGKRGTILRVVDDQHVVVEGINKIKKHQRPNPMAGIAGGIIERENAVDVSNVAIVNPVTQKADRIGFKILEDGRKVRIFKSNGEMLDA